MSSTLFWRPASPPEGNYLSDALKFVLRERHDLLNGSAILTTRSSADYLQGLADAKLEGATELLRVLRKHGSIEIWEES